MRSRVPAILAGAAAIIVATIAALLVVEAVLLATGRQPITWYVMCATAAFPLWTFAVVAVVASGFGALIAHFFWSHADMKPPRPV